jgi:hypothetical protein
MEGGGGADQRPDGSAGRDAGTGGRGTDGSGGRIGTGLKGGAPGTGSAGGMGPPEDAAVADSGGTEVASLGGADGGAGDGPEDHGAVEVGTSDGSIDQGPADAPPTDASAPDGGSADATSDAASSPDARACVAPWNASNVPARIFTPSPTGSTACSIAGPAVPTLAAGVDTTNFRGAGACGACLRVQAVSGAAAVVVPVVERSTATGILLTRAAMDQIAKGADLVNVDWTLVPCDVGSQPARYYIKEGTNAGYLGVQVRNVRYPVAAVAAAGTSTNISLMLKSYGYWESTSVGAGPLTLRLTDINGQTFDEPGVKLDPMTEFVGKGQFPICR